MIILTKQEKVKEGLYPEGLITGIDFFCLHIDGQEPITNGLLDGPITRGGFINGGGGGFISGILRCSMTRVNRLVVANSASLILYLACFHL